MSIILIYFSRISNECCEADSYTNHVLAKHLYKQGLLAKVICADCNEKIDIPNSYIKKINSFYFIKFINKILRLIKFIYSSFHQRHYEEILFDLITSIYIRKIDAKILYCSRPLFPICTKLCKKKGIKIIIRASVVYPFYNYLLIRNEEKKYKLQSISPYSNNKRVFKLINVLNQSDKIIVPDPKVAKFTYDSYQFKYNKNKIIRQTKIFCHKNLNDLNNNLKDNLRNSKNTSNSLTFLSVSYMNLIKGIQYLLKAWNIFMKAHRLNAKLILIGPVDKNIYKIYKRLFFQTEGIIFRGYQENPFFKFNYVDAFICSSISDASPATIIEAMSYGIPIISSRNCGFSNIIHDGKEGFTYEFNDVVRLAEIFYWFSINRLEVDKMRKNVINKAKMFSKENYIKEINSIFKENL